MEFELTHVRTMARYNQWMNSRLYQLAAQLTDEQRKQDRGAFFKSIHGTLNHLLVADSIWFGRFTQKPFPAKSLDQELYSDFVQLRAERERMDQQILEWADALTLDDWNSELRFTPISNPVERVMPMWLVITHFFNHQTHHRGQITTLFMQMGIDPGVTDLPYMPQ
ncbi:MAG TPA: DinB family protein [Pseudohongiella sp.]|nr:DinB family protein [Pseudohongiella sp.]